jgi:hypothetical protein
MYLLNSNVTSLTKLSAKCPIVTTSIEGLGPANFTIIGLLLIVSLLMGVIKKKT